MQHGDSRPSETRGDSKKDTQGGNNGYRVDFNLDELHNTNSRVISQCVRFSSSTFFVPQEQPIHLLFLRMVFNKLRAQSRCPIDGPADEEKLPIEAFDRAFERLFFVLQDPAGFDVRDYDENGDGFVTWIEFFNVYRQRHITVRLSLCERIFLTFDDPDSSVFAQILSLVVLSIIVVSSMCFVLSTVDEFQIKGQRPLLEAPTADPALKHIDTACLVVFCIEYMTRLATCWNVRFELFRKSKLLNLIVGFEPIHLSGRFMRVVKFIFTPTNLIDLAAILPAVISSLVGSGGGGLVVLRLIRLARIFRAFKSPALIEPVIIIGRTLQHSTKALYVLAFNLLLGVVIAGSLMFIAEGQGKWDEAAQRYTRRVGWRWNATSGLMEEETEISPFQSIPHTFWWAMVTITTVGYGDANNYPRTAWGFLVTTLTMVFSLVMLALPVGVIGGTFSQVWSEFDEEKQREAEMVRQELFFVTTSLQRLDPEQMCRMMLIEVWDDHSNFGEAARGVREAKVRSSPFRFMGEAKLELELPCSARVTRQLKLPLQPNTDLVCRKVSGDITMRYSWTPAALQDLSPRRSPRPDDGDLKGVDVIGIGKIRDPELKGTLEVTIVKAERLINLGNTGRNGISNPYCMVFVYPDRPAEGALLQPCVWRTPTAHKTLNPSWQVCHTFGYDWTLPDRDEEEEVETKVERGFEVARNDCADGATKLDEVMQLLRVLTGELRHVKDEVRTLNGRLDALTLQRPPSALRALQDDRQQNLMATSIGNLA